MSDPIFTLPNGDTINLCNVIMVSSPWGQRSHYTVYLSRPTEKDILVYDDIFPREKFIAAWSNAVSGGAV